MQNWKLSLNKKCECKSEIVACIGYFDGLHQGHKGLIDQTLELAKRKGAESALITFDPDPWVTIKGIHDIKHISTMEQRQKLAEQFGIQHFFILDFTSEMSSLTPEKFMGFILDQIHLVGLVCGFDFHYGAKGAGSVDTLTNLAQGNFEFIHVNSINDERGKISSSRIASCIEEGRMREAKDLLGYPYTMIGKVIHGNHKGSTALGFPTANVEVESEFLLPRQGVYIGKVHVLNHDYMAMVNVGHNPTFNERHMISIEAHILNFHHDIYGEKINVSFYEFIREEKKFDTIEELIHQLQLDVKKTAEYFNHE